MKENNYSSQIVHQKKSQIKIILTKQRINKSDSLWTLVKSF